MATVVDASRPANKTHACAMNKFTQPTPRIMNNVFLRVKDAPETHIPNLSVAVTPVDNKADNDIASHPVMQFDTFWLPKTAKTVRLA